MSEPARPLNLEEEDVAALTAAVEESLADPRAPIPHETVRAWLLQIAAGNLDAPPPLPEQKKTHSGL
jgi:hypothetical protein